MALRKCNYVIAGIGGVTNGGKTSLCRKLKEKLSADSLHMDYYFWPEGSPNHTPLPQFNGHANWDCVSAVDFETLHNDVLKWIKKQEKNAAQTNSVEINQKPILLVEGILVLNYLPLRKLFTHKYFMVLEKPDCVARRQFRVYDPPDPEGYFDDIVWPEYEKSYQELRNDQDINFIQGADDANKTYNRIYKELTS